MKNKKTKKTKNNQKETPVVPVYDIQEVRNCLFMGWTNWDDIRYSAFVEWAIKDHFKNK